MMEESVKAKFGVFPTDYAKALASAYVEKFRSLLSEVISEKREKLCQRRAELQREYDASATLVRLMQELTEIAVYRRAHRLHHGFSSTLPTTSRSSSSRSPSAAASIGSIRSITGLSRPSRISERSASRSDTDQPFEPM